MNRSDFWELQRTIGFEFSRYILKHPEVAERIPPGALIVFQVRGNVEFNRWAKKTARLRRQRGQQVLTVDIERLLPPLETRLVNPRLQPAMTV